MDSNGNISAENFKHLEKRMDGFEKQLQDVEKQIQEVGKGINDIKAAMVGNEMYPGGMKIVLDNAQAEIKILQTEVALLKERQKTDRTYVIGMAAGLALAISVGWTVFTFIFKSN
jgi:CHASE3 domain sensor protein